MLGTRMVAMDAYGIAGIPHIILFGPDGTILRRGLRGEEIDQVLKEYLPANALLVSSSLDLDGTRPFLEIHRE